MKLLRRLLLMLTVIVLLSASVQAAELNSITVLHDRDGIAEPDVAFSLYALEESFQSAQEAYAALLAEGEAPLHTAVTDSNGEIVFEDLPDGYYLLTGQSYKVENQVCEPEMSLLQLPADLSTAYIGRNIVVEPKYELKDPVKETVYRVLLIWDDADSALRPDSAAVQLFRNDENFASVSIGYTENWQYSWTETDPLAVWSVLGTTLENYTVSYSKDGNTFVITYTLQKTGSPNESSPEKLPQTGQLWWPIPFLAVLGCVLIPLGLTRKQNRRIVLFASGAVLILVAAVCTGNNLLQSKRAEAASADVIDVIVSNTEISGTALTESTNTTPPDYVRFPNIEMPKVTVGDDTYIGVLDIPLMDLELPVCADWDYDALKATPCRYQGSAYDNSLIIMAHNYDSHFGQLHKLRPGDEIHFTDTAGNRFLYEVADLEEISGTDVEGMSAGDWDLTLFTCNFSGQNRITVRCIAREQNMVRN